MDRMKRFFDVYVPTETCNLTCSYCYVNQQENISKRINKIDHTPLEIRKALSKKRLGGVCFFNFCGGGETLLGEDILPVIYEVLLEGHYVQIVTNGTISKRFNEICHWRRDLLERIFWKFSFHFIELRKRNLLETYFNNINKVSELGCSFTVELMPHDNLMPHIQEIKDLCLKYVGALPHLTVGRDESSRELKLLSKYTTQEYHKIWGQFKSDMFDLKMKLFGKEQHDFCYAGEWSCSLRLDTGDLFQCNGVKYLDNIYVNPDKPIHFLPVGHKCPHAHCYNCHAYMALGVFPDRNFPVYAKMRDRITISGKHWLQPKIYNFFSQILSENNIVYFEKKKKYRILLIGDSIREGYGKYVKDELKGVADVLEVPENARFAAYTLRTVWDWARQLAIGTDIDLIYWNNGLWDVVRICGDEPQTSVEEYTNILSRIIERFHILFPNAKIIFANTTPVIESEYNDFAFLRSNQDIVMYNNKASELMKIHDIRVDDIYSFVKCYNLNDIYFDCTHLNEKGNRILGHHIAEYILNKLEKVDEIDSSNLVFGYQNIKNKDVIIYGYGVCGKEIRKELEEKCVSIIELCDLNKAGQFMDGYMVISPKELKKYKDKNVIVVIAIKDVEEYGNVTRYIRNSIGLEYCHYSVVGLI